MKPRFKLRSVRPLESLADAEKRIKGRDFSVDRWMRGEGPRFFTVERVAAMKAENEALRRGRK